MKNTNATQKPTGIRYCRSCYNHLAGYVGVAFRQSLEKNGFLKKEKDTYQVTQKGWKWLNSLGIKKEQFLKSKRPLTRQCIDGTEKKPHIAGQLGDALLKKMLEEKWVERISTTRALSPTQKGQKEFFDKLHVNI